MFRALADLGRRANHDDADVRLQRRDRGLRARWRWLRRRLPRVPTLASRRATLSGPDTPQAPIPDEKGGFVLARAWRRIRSLSRNVLDLATHTRREVLLASLALNFTALALPVAMLQIYDRIIPHTAYSTLSMLVVGLMVATVADTILRQLRSQIAAWEGARYEFRRYQEAIDRTLAADVREIEATPIGIHLDRMTRIDSLRDYYTMQSGLILVDMPFIVLFLMMMAYIGHSMVLVPIVLVALFGAFCLMASLGLRDASDERARLDDRRYNFILEVLSGIHTIKAMAMERLILRRYERLLATGAQLGFRINVFSNMIQNLSAGFSQTTTVAVATFGCFEVINGNASMGALAACTMLSGRIVQPVLRLVGIWARFQTVRISEERLREMERLEAERAHHAEAAGPIASLALDGVAFSYGSGSALFDQASLSVERGECIGITGINGAGKSTLLWMLMGGLKPASGAVLANGRSIFDFDAASVRGQIAYLPQKAQLFDGTVLENLCRFDIDANLAQALDLAAALDLDRVFAALPEGYETRVGDGGVLLPPGVAQRIGIVRALIGKPQVILFDEANTGLDQRADEKVIALLERYRTHAIVVIVTFRPSLLATANRVYRIADHRLVEQHNAPVLSGGSGTVVAS